MGAKSAWRQSRLLLWLRRRIAQTEAGPAAAAALGALAGGDQVLLRRAENGSDRYGRLFAYAYTLRDGDEFLLQQEPVAEGFARAAPASQIRAPGTFWTAKGRPGRLNLAYGPIRIMRCLTPRRRKMPWRSEADLLDRGRAENLREFRPAALWGHYGYDPETKRAQFRGGGS